jgi:hypothetical protein
VEPGALAGHGTLGGDGGSHPAPEGGAGGGGADPGGGATELGHGGTENEGDSFAALDELVSAYCQVAVECCPSYAGFPDVPTCVDAVIARIPFASILTDAVRVDLEKVETCRAAIASSTACGAAPTNGCSQIFVAAQLPGQPCRDDRECVQTGLGVDCVTSDSPSVPDGICTEIALVGEGEDCLASCLSREGPCQATTGRGKTADACRLSEGLYCNTASPHPTCEPILEEGDYCGDFYSCGVDAQCYYDATLPGEPTVCVGTEGFVGCEEVGCAGDLRCHEGECRSPETFEEMTGCGSALLALW